MKTSTTSRSFGHHLVLKYEAGSRSEEVFVQRMSIGSGESDSVHLPEVSPGFARIVGDRESGFVLKVTEAGGSVFNLGTGCDVTELALEPGVAFRGGGTEIHCEAHVAYAMVRTL